VKLAGGNQLTAHGLILGTVHCMAPEQIRGGDIDARTDIYALGVVLFRMVTGKYPFNSKQTAEVLAAHLHAAVPTFASIDPDLRVPPDLENVVRRCMQKNQDNRYQSCSELIHDLELSMRVPREEWVLAGAPTPVAPTAVADPRTNSSGLLMLFILGLFTLVMLLLLIIVVLLAQSDKLSARSADEVPVAAVQVAEPEPEPEAEPERPVDTEDTDEEAEADDEQALDEEPEAGGTDEAEAPSPRPRPRPRSAPEPEPEPEAAVDEPDEPEARPEPAPAAPRYARNVTDLDVTTSADEVRVTMKVKGGDVRPLHFASEKQSGDYAKQYQVVFRNVGSTLDRSTVQVGHPLVDSVATSMVSGSLVVQVNSRGKPRMRLEGDSSPFTVVVTP
jgi:cytoskeletal protein RodZ